MKKYRVILADRKSCTAENNNHSAGELMLGLVSSTSATTAVRLARCASHLEGGWELRWGKRVALGVATAALVGGPLSGEAQASAMHTAILPQVQAMESHFVPWRGVTVSDTSSEAVPSLDLSPRAAGQSGLLAQGGTGGSLHSNSEAGHTNMAPTEHSNTDWTNHTNGGHSNGPWWNHVNNGGGTDEFGNDVGHINTVQGDFIF